jgi:hypothetical protein
MDLSDLIEADDLGAEAYGRLFFAALDLPVLRLCPGHQLEEGGEAPCWRGS